MRTWRVDDVMSVNVAAVRADTPYREIVDLLTGRRISAVPVVDEDHRVVGVVSEGDLMHKVERGGHPDGRPMFEGPRGRAARIKAGADVARDLMTTPAVTTTGDTSIAEAARTMHRRGLKRLPVVDGEGRVVGMVTRGDLLKVHLRPDDDIRAEVAEQVLWRVLAVQEGTVQVSVTEGVVRLTGLLDRRSAADLAVRLARQIGGVVDVTDELRYDFDDADLPGYSPLTGLAKQR